MKPLRSSPIFGLSGIRILRESGKQTIRVPVLLLAIVAVSIILIPPAGANAAPPLTTLSFFFENTAVPINETVFFTMNCSAFACDPASGICPNRHVVNRYGDVFSLSAVCPSYGCFHQEHATTDYELLTSCDFIGETGGKGFVILNDTQPAFSCRMNGQEQSCDLKIDLSFATITPSGTRSGTDEKTVILMKPRGELGEPISGIDAFLCLVKRMFGGTC